MRRNASRLLALALLVMVSGLPAVALETDQFYGWTRPLTDSTDVLNAKVNLEIARALESLNRRPARDRVSCRAVTGRISERFRFFVFHPIELWVANTKLVDRIPGTAEEELDYRKRYLFWHLGRHELANWVPPSPTIEVNGVRIGTDKLSHFFSEGFWYYKAYVNSRRRGLSVEQAELRSIDLGIATERSVLGQTSSGVFSSGDLEANHQGMLFFKNLCEGDEPALAKSAAGWQMTRPFDWRDFVTPEWDESYQPFALSPRRWKKIRPALIQYCDQLSHPSVRARREAYARRDKVTRTESRVRERVAEGAMPDPQDFSIETNCDAVAVANAKSRAAGTGGNR